MRATIARSYCLQNTATVHMQCRQIAQVHAQLYFSVIVLLLNERARAPHLLATARRPLSRFASTAAIRMHKFAHFPLATVLCVS